MPEIHPNLIPPRQALLVFTQAPQVESAGKRLAPRQPLSRRIAEQVTARLLREAGGLAGVDLWVVTPVFEDPRITSLARGASLNFLPQRGEGFGARFEAAVSDCFALGYDQVVAVGGDLPALTRRHLREAFEHLSSGSADSAPPVALGPCPDGGYYLLGMHGFQPGIFRDIPWQTSGVLAATLHRVAQAGLALRVLGASPDLDGATDLASARQVLAPLARLCALAARLHSDIHLALDPLDHFAATVPLALPGHAGVGTARAPPLLPN